MKSLTTRITLWMTFLLGFAPNAGAAAIPIASYDIDQTPMSGFGCWDHTYTGLITDLGRTVSSWGSCTVNGTHIARYTGGSGTLNDGFISPTGLNTQLFFIGLADDAQPVIPVIVLHLAIPATINNINFFGSYSTTLGPPGALNGASIEIGGQSAALSLSPAGTANPIGIYPDGTINLTGMTLAHIPTSTIVLRNFTTSFFGSPIDVFSLTEITIDGTPAISVNIDIYPGNAKNRTELDDPIPVAILSSPGFDAPTAVLRSSLTFGELGTEASLIACQPAGRDVNGDGRPDLVCYFAPSKTGLKLGDISAALMGTTTTGVRIRGQDMISIYY